MNLKTLKDNELLSQTKQLVQNERELLTKILKHLREVERRKLFSDLGYQSLFEYSVKELNYSEGQAGRRIQAMRLIAEFPQVEEKIEMGKLSLSNISQAQSYFREIKKIELKNQLTSRNAQTGEVIEPEGRLVSKGDLECRERKGREKLDFEGKLKILEKLENKSTREGQKMLSELQPQSVLPKERERVLAGSLIEVRFVINEDLKSRLKELRSLLGTKGTSMSLAELVDYMTGASIEALKIKKFGKKRVQSQMTVQRQKLRCDSLTPARSADQNSLFTPAQESRHVKGQGVGGDTKDFYKKGRSISRAIQHQVWVRDQGRCCHCGSQKNLNIDHIKPVALGGGAESENLRLLCFHCNQRQAMKVFGVDHVLKWQSGKCDHAL